MGGRVRLLTAAVIPLVDRAAGEGADGAADDRADRAVAAAGDFMAGKTARDRADHGAAGAVVALAIIAAVIAVVATIAAIIAAVAAIVATVIAIIATVVAGLAAVIARIDRKNVVEGRRGEVRVKTRV